MSEDGEDEKVNNEDIEKIDFSTVDEIIDDLLKNITVEFSGRI